MDSTVKNPKSLGSFGNKIESLVSKVSLVEIKFDILCRWIESRFDDVPEELKTTQGSVGRTIQRTASKTAGVVSKQKLGKRVPSKSFSNPTAKMVTSNGKIRVSHIERNKQLVIKLDRLEADIDPTTVSSEEDENESGPEYTPGSDNDSLASDLDNPSEFREFSDADELESTRSHEEFDVWPVNLLDQVVTIKEEQVDDENIAQREKKKSDFQSILHKNKEKTKKRVYFQCTTCDKRFNLNIHLKNHIRLMHKYEVTEAKKSRKKSIKKSTVQARKGRRVKCSRQPSTEYDSASENSTIFSWKGEVSCRSCRKVFKSHKYLKMHRKNPCRTEHKCDFCEKILYSKSALKYHRFGHTKEKTHTCPTCNRSFGRSNTLKNHMFLHEEERRFKCTKCDKTFKQRQSLYLHEKVHDGTRKTLCPVCGKICSNPGNLQKHISSVHEQLRLYSCSICQTSFKTQTHLKYHVNTHNNPNGRKRGLNKEKNTEESQTLPRTKVTQKDSSVKTLKASGNECLLEALIQPQNSLQDGSSTGRIDGTAVTADSASSVEINSDTCVPACIEHSTPSSSIPNKSSVDYLGLLHQHNSAVPVAEQGAFPTSKVLNDDGYLLPL